MKIESTNNIQMLYKGVADNAKKIMDTQESERLKAALDPGKKTTTSFIENKGVYFDAKA